MKHKKFGEQLRSLRKSKRLTQKQLGAALGVSYSAISMYERGQRRPKLKALAAIADYFGVSMGYMLGRKE